MISCPVDIDGNLVPPEVVYKGSDSQYRVIASCAVYYIHDYHGLDPLYQDDCETK